MAQTVRSILLQPGHKLLMIEKPLVLRRIFFSVRAIASQTYWSESQISLGDPNFRSYYILGGPVNYFGAGGEGIFQGDIWVRNESGIDIFYSATEILH